MIKNGVLVVGFKIVKFPSEKPLGSGECLVPVHFAVQSKMAANVKFQDLAPGTHSNKKQICF